MLHPKQYIGVSRTMKLGRMFKDFIDLLVCIKKLAVVYGAFGLIGASLKFV